eukprot:Sspe_Gene.42182::Locus_20471_Transcript_1_1_Confidence_1.000_Length_2281::g.42182::m.42182
MRLRRWYLMAMLAVAASTFVVHRMALSKNHTHRTYRVSATGRHADEMAATGMDVRHRDSLLKHEAHRSERVEDIGEAHRSGLDEGSGVTPKPRARDADRDTHSGQEGEKPGSGHPRNTTGPFIDIRYKEEDIPRHWRAIQEADDGRFDSEKVARFARDAFTSTFNLTALPSGEVKKGHRNRRFPDAICQKPFPQRFYLAGYVDPVPPEMAEMSTKSTVTLRAAQYARIVSQRLRKVKGSHFLLLENTSLPRSISRPPILDTHGGHFDLYAPWPVRQQGLAERGGWSIQWHRNVSEAWRLPQVLPSSPSMWGAVIPNAFVNQGHVLTCDFAFVGGGCTQRTLLPFLPKRNLEKVLAVCDGWCFGYFHFTHEHLPRIALMYNVLVSDPSIKILVPTTKKGFVPFVVQYLIDVFGFSRDRLTTDGPVFAKWVYYPQPQQCGHVFTNTAMLLRHIVFSRHGLTNVAPNLGQDERFGVLLAEREKMSRMPENFHTLKAELLEWGYAHHVHFESFERASVLDQVKLFNRVDMVVGPHGANLANVLWMRQGTTVLEFQPYQYGNMCYYTTAQRLGVTWRFILYDGNKVSAYTHNTHAHTHARSFGS